MSKLLQILFIGFLLFHLPAFGQNMVITGRVTDKKDGAPLPGVSVSVKSSPNTGTQTDGSGNFRLTIASKNSILLFRFIGYKPIESAIKGNVVNISMDADSKQLSEIVVVGYGTQSRQALTGSVAKIGGADVANQPVPSLESAIQGRAAGVFVEAQNGKVGQAIKVRVRGSSSVSAGSDPLYVVDGLPITTADLSNAGGATNPLSDLNQNDIESIEILKDASAGAIYGSRASNGVVLITTKKGKAGNTKVTYNQYYGFSKPTNERDFMNAEQFVNYMRQAAVGAGKQDYLNSPDDYDNEQAAIDDELSFVESRLLRYAAGSDNYKTYQINTNWQDEVFQKAPVQNYNLTFQGGTDKTKFYVSGTYNNQKGILINNGLNQYSTRLNLENQATNWLSIGANLSLSRTRNSRLSGDNAFSTPMQIVALSPITPVIDPRTGLLSGALDPATSRPNTNYPVYYNPLLSSQGAFYNTLVYRNLGNVFAQVNILPELKFRSEIGVDVLNQNEDGYYGKVTARNSSTPNGYGVNYGTNVLNINTNNFFQFNKLINKNSIDATAGMSFQRQRIDATLAEGQQFPSDAFKKLTSAGDIVVGSSTVTEYSLLSYFARINYNYDTRYLLSLSGRVDGSSRFGANNRYGFFPAASAGWVISEEEFLKDQNLLSTLKLRASYGITGNSEIGNFGSRSLYRSYKYNGTAGSRPFQLGNPDLKWETTAQLDLGLDFGFFNGRITGEFDVYDKRTKDLLLNVQIPATTGFTTVTRNLGNLQNRGLEIGLNSQNIVGKFQWSSSFNLAFNRNKITNLQGQVITGTGDGVNRAVEGQPIGVFFMPEFAGADPQNGDALWIKNTPLPGGGIDRSTTNNYNEATFVTIGNPNPRFIGGLGNRFSYKNFDLDVQLQFTYGNQIYNGGGQYMSASGSNGFDNQTIDQLQAWKNPGDITSVPEARLFYANGVQASSRYLDNGSYLRVKRAGLGYTFPKTILSKIKVDNLRIYAQAINLFTWTKYKGWDPEVNSDDFANNITQGYDFYAAPQAKTITFGLTVGF